MNNHSNSNSNFFEEIQKKLQDEKPNTNIIESKIVSRNQYFSKNSDISDMRNQIQSNELTLRKSTRNEEFENRRRFTSVINDTSSSMKNYAYFGQDLKEKIERIETNREMLEMYIQSFRSTIIEEKYFGLISIRKLLAMNKNAPITEIINSGLVSDLLELLNHNIIEFQYESLWCLTNISSGDSEDTYSIINKNGISLIMQKFDSNISEIQEQAIWVIGNIAGDSTLVRDKILKLNCIDKIVCILKSADRVQLAKNCAWALSNFCRGKPVPDYEHVKPVILMIKIIKTINNYTTETDILIDTTWILSYLSENYKKTISLIISSKILPKIVSFLSIKIIHLQLQSIRIISNISTCDSVEVQAIIDSGMIPHLKNMVFHERSIIRKEACLILSNIAAGTDLQTEQLIVNDFVKILGTIIRNDIEDVQKEAIYAIANLTTVDKFNIAKIILDEGILEYICYALNSSKNDVLLVSLEALYRLLDYGRIYFLTNEGNNPIVQKLLKTKTTDRLEELQLSQSNKIFEISSKIIEQFFDNENAN